MKKIIHSENAPAAIGPYTQAVMGGNTLYISGQIAFEASQQNNVAAETSKVLENMGHILQQAGLGYENVVKTTIFLKSMDDFSKVNEVYAGFFNENYPARETVEVSQLPKNVNVEISCIAVKF